MTSHSIPKSCFTFIKNGMNERLLREGVYGACKVSWVRMGTAIQNIQQVKLFKN